MILSDQALNFLHRIFLLWKKAIFIWSPINFILFLYLFVRIYQTFNFQSTDTVYLQYILAIKLSFSKYLVPKNNKEYLYEIIINRRGTNISEKRNPVYMSILDSNKYDVF